MVTLTYQERFKTAKGVFDEFTNRTLFELHSRGHFEELISPLKVGKESNVFLAKNKTGKQLIVKIYRVQNCDFHKMYGYIRQDPRYEFLSRHPRQIILAWTQREYKNLLKAERARVNVPKAIAVMNHVLVEEMVGGEEPALPLKDIRPKHPQLFLELIVIEMKKLYEGGLVHGDLSSFNILNFEEKPYLIDFSQATLTKTLNAEELLGRDVKNIALFFKKLGVNCDLEEMFFKITGKKKPI